MNFSYENLGTNTFLVYEIKDNDDIDSMSLGMLTNNSIPGFAAAAFTQMDATKYIKYNVSSKIPASQLFSGPVNRKRLLGVFTGIVNAMLSAEDYMLDPQTVVLDMDYIFTDVSTCETVLVCLPVYQEAKPPVDLGMFFKNIIFTTQFDQTENCVHVAQILNYLNGAPVLVLEDFKAVLDRLSAPVLTPPVPTHQPPMPTHQPPRPVPPVPPQPVPPQPVPPVPVPPQPQPVPQPVPPQPAPPQPVPPQHMPPQPHGFAVPGGQPGVVTPPVATPPAGGKAADGQKPMSAFYLLQHYNKENAAIYKEQKEQMKQNKQKDKPAKAKKEKAPKGGQPGFNVPGQAPATSFAVPGQAPAAPFAVPGQAPATPFAVPGQQPAGVPAQRPVGQQPAIQRPAGQQPAVQPAVAQKPAFQQPPVQPKPVTAPPAAINFGATVVLGGETQGTTVLGAAPEVVEPKPTLIRLKTNEKAVVNKPTFKMGKEQSYVDFAILGNSAISRSHATIYMNNGEFQIEDTNSTNHTYVDGKMIPSNVRTPMPIGCKIRLADEEFEFKMC